MEKKILTEKLTECFKKCGMARIQLRKCVVNAMNAGLTKTDLLDVIEDLSKKKPIGEASLCAEIAIGQAIRYEASHSQGKTHSISNNEKTDIIKKFSGCFKKCELAKRQMKKCVTNGMNAGLSKDEVIAITDDIVGGLGKNQVSACAIIAIDQALRFEETNRKTPIDVSKERELERGDF